MLVPGELGLPWVEGAGSVCLSPPLPSAPGVFQGIPTQLLSLYLQGDVWICMELMDTSLDKFYKKVLEKKKTIPEDILGKMAVSVSASWVHKWFCAPPRPCSDACHPSRETQCCVLPSWGVECSLSEVSAQAHSV